MRGFGFEVWDPLLIVVGDMRSKSAHWTGMKAAKMASGKFSIDDAFESDEEDPIRVYGSTTESLPLKGKTRYSSLPDDTKDEDHEIPREVCH